MKTLVIHPYDPSTEFLKDIYADINATVVRHLPARKAVLQDLMGDHDQIIGLGHGSPNGLFSMRSNYIYAIGNTDKSYLSGKQNIYIWCHADKYVKAHTLAGFSSGMFISEVEEAAMYGIQASRAQIELSNYAFAVTLGRALREGQDPISAGKTVIEKYVDESDQVINFNNNVMLIR
jgi:hypothetical protein